MLFKKRPKVFCIGRNKTGTTSLAMALTSFGYRLAPQHKAELLTEDWARRSFGSLVKYCRKYEAFQDVPFSLDFSYIALDQAYPGSKFILSVRDSSEQWFSSMVRFTAKMIGVDRTPTAEDLANFQYRGETARRGEIWMRHQLVYGATAETVFDRDLYIRHYEEYNRTVRQYFRHRPDDLLVLNLADSDSMERLCRFLDIPFSGQTMPKENTTS